MGRWSSLYELQMRVKTLMGLERFEVRFFFGQKFTKTDLALEVVIKNLSKVIWALSVMFSRVWLKHFFLSKVIWEHHSIQFFFTNQKKISYRSGPMEVSKYKSASVRSKTYLYDSSETTDFVWVKTPMGIKRFDIHIERFLDNNLLISI